MGDAPGRIFKKYVITYTVVGEDDGGLDRFVRTSSLAEIEADENGGNLHGSMQIAEPETLTLAEANLATGDFFWDGEDEEDGDA